MPALAAFEHGQDYFFILFEYAENTLEKLLNSSATTFTSQQLWEQARGLASGLAHIHCIPVGNGQEKDGKMVHRDLKPANVLIVGNVMKIADFGFADWNPGSADTDSMSGEYSTYGAYNNYCPPLDGKVSDKYDIYSLGAMISEIACFDLGQGPCVASYRKKRFADVVEGSQTSSWRFYYYNLNSMKRSVAEEHHRILGDVEECSRDPLTSMQPWQEFFYQRALFDLVEKMIHGSAAERPTAAYVEEALAHFTQRAYDDAAHNFDDRRQHHVVNSWLETVAPVLAKIENRLYAITPNLESPKELI
jgi:serine/threonine protein kinase